MLQRERYSTNDQKGLYIGTSGISVPIPRSDYPEGFKESSRLVYYSSKLNSLEINSTFYRLPQEATLMRWQQEVPTEFTFTFKLPKIISHAQQLLFDGNDIQQFLNTVANVRNKGCILIQLPPSRSIEAFAALQSLLKALKPSQWKLAIEFRNETWYTDEVMDLLKHYSAAVVMHDHKKGVFFNVIPQPFYYLRFHGPESNYRGTYTDEALQQFSGYINDFLRQGKEVYCYFNNTMGAAFENAGRIFSLCR
jgi:uncharacterized protein YecE (DUF72 family)